MLEFTNIQATTIPFPIERTNDDSLFSYNDRLRAALTKEQGPMLIHDQVYIYKICNTKFLFM